MKKTEKGYSPGMSRESSPLPPPSSSSPPQMGFFLFPSSFSFLPVGSALCLRPALLLEGRQSADVVPEGGGLALGLGQHEHLLLGESAGHGRVLLTEQEVVVGPGHCCCRGNRKQHNRGNHVFIVRRDTIEYCYCLISGFL